ncbi:MAG: response regulator [Planctomycetales bacterium]|nr:response regulator [Planctomycetales bacterium]
MTHGEEPIVYVVDDEPAIRQAIALLLHVNGIQTQVFASPGEFLEMPSLPRRCCLVLDARMPGMSGLELLDRLAERKWAVPVFLITGHGDENMLEAAHRKGVVKCFNKPFDNDDFVASIRNAMPS